MPSRRVLAFAAVAFLAGAIVAAALLFEGSPGSLVPGFAPSLPVAVKVNNIGTRDANITVEVTQVEGSAQGNRAYLLRTGQSQRDDYVQGRGQFIASITAQWVGDATSSSRGTARIPGTTEGCRGDEGILLFDVDIDTSRGVSFSRLDATCV